MRSLRESVDLSRLSRIALSNLEKDDAAADYTAAQPATAGGDITIDSTDAELDFEEVQEQGESVSVHKLLLRHSSGRNTHAPMSSLV